MSVRFSTWTSRVNWHCKRDLFASLDELPDVDLYPLYQQGLSPRSAFESLIFAGAWADEYKSFKLDCEVW